MSRILLRKIRRWLPALLLAGLAAGCADDPYSPAPAPVPYYPYGPYAYGWPGADYAWDYDWYGAYGYGPYWCCGYYGWPGGFYGGYYGGWNNGWNGGHGPWPGGPGRPPPGGWHHYPSPHYPGAMHPPPVHFSHSRGH